MMGIVGQWILVLAYYAALFFGIQTYLGNAGVFIVT